MTHHHETATQPAQFLQENIDLLPTGKVLDIAMGRGRNAVYLASRGFEVEGIDISTEAVRTALESARKAGVTIKAEVADLQGRYSIKKEHYDVIICFNYLQRLLIPSIKDGVRRGGVVVYETFIVDQAKLFGKPSNPDYLLKHNELLDMFREFRCLRYREGVIGNRAALAGIVAQKV
jgi:tellurite methyltransferase